MSAMRDRGWCVESTERSGRCSQNLEIKFARPEHRQFPFSEVRSADVNCGEPVFPDCWIGWRAILPSGSAENECNLRDILALAVPEGLEKDAYGIEALEHRDRVCRF